MIGVEHDPGSWLRWFLAPGFSPSPFAPGPVLPWIVGQQPHGRSVLGVGADLALDGVSRGAGVGASTVRFAEEGEVESGARQGLTEVDVQALLLVEADELDARLGRHARLVEVVEVRLELLDLRQPRIRRRRLLLPQAALRARAVEPPPAEPLLSLLPCMHLPDICDAQLLAGCDIARRHRRVRYVVDAVVEAREG